MPDTREQPTIAELGMYPFASVRWAWDALWSAVHERAPWVPAVLAHSGDVHARWVDDRCVVNQICGWPFARYHADRHLVVGTFSLTIPEADGHRYRSTLLARHDAPLSSLVRHEARVVANSADSLSGWVSFLNATVGPKGRWPGHVTYTAAHAESVRMLAAGHADVACIDSWTLAILSDEQPELVEPLHRVGHGPLVPSPVVTVRAELGSDRAGELAAAFADAIASNELGEATAAIRIDGFVRTTLDEYLATLSLANTGV